MVFGENGEGVWQEVTDAEVTLVSSHTVYFYSSSMILIKFQYTVILMSLEYSYIDARYCHS